MNDDQRALSALKMAEPEIMPCSDGRRIGSVSPASMETECSPVKSEKRECSLEEEPNEKSTKESESEGIRATMLSHHIPNNLQDKVLERRVRISHPAEEIIYKETGANRSIKRERTPTPDEEPTRRVVQITEPVQLLESRSASPGVMAKLVLENLWSNDVTTLQQAMKRLGAYLYRPGSDHAMFAETQKVFFQLGGHLAVLRVMKQHSNHKMLQISSLGLLWNVVGDNPKYQTSIAMAKGMQATLAAMKRFPYDKFIVHLGLGALYGITCNHGANTDLLVRRIGGIPFLLEQMTAFKENQHIILRGCQMLQNFCRCRMLRIFMLEARAVTALAAAIDGHKDNRHIQQAARSTMKGLLFQ